MCNCQDVKGAHQSAQVNVIGMKKDQLTFWEAQKSMTLGSGNDQEQRVENGTQSLSLG